MQALHHACSGSYLDTLPKGPVAQRRDILVAVRNVVLHLERIRALRVVVACADEGC